MDESPDGSAGADDEAPSSRYAVSRLNATRHGILSQHTVLPWEDARGYDELLAALQAEHRPAGPTEDHLVEELAGIMWRKHRLRLAEAASFRRGFRYAVETPAHRFGGNAAGAAALAAAGRRERPDDGAVTEAIHGDPKAAERALREWRSARKKADRALEILRDEGAGAYGPAVEALDRKARDMWEDERRELPPETTAEDAVLAEALESWIVIALKPVIDWHLAALTHRKAIRAQAFGDAFDADRLQHIARYETHLDRKLEKMLAMLVKLQELRRARGDGGE
jgi:hypothetical protein